jgi:hypothetical protein
MGVTDLPAINRKEGEKYNTPYSILSQGKTLLKITRQGEGKETSYKVEAAD